MKKKEDSDIFISLVKGVTPLKKKNNLKKPIPKQKTKFKKNELKKSTTQIKADIPPKIKKTSINTNELNSELQATNRKLKRGKITINKRVDFHGTSLGEARQIFIHTIDECYSKNHRCILFVTGKGINKKPEDNLKPTRLYYGKIRDSFTDWLKEDKIKQKILNVQQAGPKHGGDGAFFVYLRKNKN